MARKPALEIAYSKFYKVFDKQNVSVYTSLLYNFVVNKNHKVTFYDIAFVEYLNVKRGNSNLSISCF